MIRYYLSFLGGWFTNLVLLMGFNYLGETFTWGLHPLLGGMLAGGGLILLFWGAPMYLMGSSSECRDCSGYKKIAKKYADELRRLRNSLKRA
jgi:hypothetical protein